jgi:GTP-binding protein EngB required for normal cell division
MSTIKVLIFGKTNVGKTSLCNLLLGCNEATSASAMGCTFETKCHRGSDPLGNNYVFWDTCGLNEPSGGKVDKKKAILKLIELIKSLNDGLNLILYVRKAEALTELDQKNLELITVFTENKIPVLIVNTNADDEKSVMNWWNRNENIFKESKNFVFTDGVSVCVGYAEDEDLDKILEKKRIQSKQILWDSFRKNRLERPKKFIENRSYALQLVLKVMQKIWNSKVFYFFSLSDIGDFFMPSKRLSKEEQLKKLLKDEGLKENEADDITLSMKILD